MVTVIDGNWSNGNSINTFSGLSGINTLGTRSLGEGFFYLEIKAIEGRANISILLSPVQDKGWTSGGAYTDSLMINPSTLSSNDRIGILLDLTGTIGYVYWNKNNSAFSEKIPLLSNSGGNILNNIKVGLVGTSSSIGATSYELIYNPKYFSTNDNRLLSITNNAVLYSFDGNYNVAISRAIIRNPSNSKIYSLDNKTLINLPSASQNNMILHGIEIGKEIKLDEAFDKIKYVQDTNEVLGEGKTFIHTVDMSNIKINKIIL